MISPCQAIRYVLIDQNLATDSPQDDWRCVLAKLPDGAGVKDNILAVVDVEGAVGDRYLSTGEIITQPKIRILCRCTSYDVGYAKMMQIADIVDMVTNYQVTISSETALLHKVSRNSGIVSAGLDGTMRRHHFSIDYEVFLK